MKVFDQINPMTLERRQWHLTILSITVIVVLFTGMALLMFPAVFSNPVILSGILLRKSFFGFCALVALLIGYLVDRQIVITHLRRRVVDGEYQIARIRQEASADLLNHLPGFDQFRDCLAMVFRRAFNIRQPLSVLVMDLKPSLELEGTSEVTTAFGDAVMAALRKLRGEDTIFRFAPGVFGIFLPGMETARALGVLKRVSDGLHDAAGASERFSFQVEILNFPDHAASAREMEQAVRRFLPEAEGREDKPLAAVSATAAR